MNDKIMTNNDNVKSSFSPSSLVHHSDRYMDTFTNGFGPNSEDIKAIYDWLKSSFDKAVVGEIATSLSSSYRSGKVDFMGVGAGDGTFDRIMVDKLRQRFGNFRYTVVEPDNVIETFQRAVEADDEFRDAVSFIWEKATFGEFYRRRPTNGRKYGFISLVHSLYYLENWKDSLTNLFDCVAEGGAVLFIVNTDDNIYMKFLQALSWKGSNYQSGMLGKLLEFLDTAKIRSTAVYIPSRINVTSCFDKASEEGSKLLDFLTETAYFRQTAPKEVLGETLDCMSSMATPGENGKLYFFTNCAAIVAFK